LKINKKTEHRKGENKNLKENRKSPRIRMNDLTEQAQLQVASLDTIS